MHRNNLKYQISGFESFLETRHAQSNNRPILQLKNTDVGIDFQTIDGELEAKNSLDPHWVRPRTL